jgi:hypothetical protein
MSKEIFFGQLGHRLRKTILTPYFSDKKKITKRSELFFCTLFVLAKIVMTFVY